MDAVPAASCIEKLTDCEPRLVKHCLANFSLNQTAPPPKDDPSPSSSSASSPVTATPSVSAPGTYALDMDKVALFRAHQVSARKNRPRNSQQSTPVGLPVCSRF